VSQPVSAPVPTVQAETPVPAADPSVHNVFAAGPAVQDCKGACGPARQVASGLALLPSAQLPDVDAVTVSGINRGVEYFILLPRVVTLS